MNNIITYKKKIRPKNLHKVGVENLGMRCLGNSSHDGCLKKKRILLNIQDLFWRKKQIFEDNFLKKIIINKYDTFQKVIVL